MGDKRANSITSRRGIATAAQCSVILSVVRMSENGVSFVIRSAIGSELSIRGSGGGSVVCVCVCARERERGREREKSR